jgi:hypothetical protein
MKTSRLMAALLVCLTSTLAAAGSFSAVIVSIDRTHSIATGSLTGARLNAGQEFMRCSVTMQSITRGIRNSGSCSARDARGGAASCSTFEPALLLAIQSIGPASEVRFGFDTANQCTFITVVQASSNLE